MLMKIIFENLNVHVCYIHTKLLDCIKNFGNGSKNQHKTKIQEETYVEIKM